MQFISPQNDFAFKRIFGNEQHKEVLISFLNSVLGLSGERQVVEVQLADPYQVPRLKQFKQSIVDISATCRSGRKFIVEMQVERQHLFHKRALYYTSKAYVEQLASGVNYPELKQVYFIGVLDFNFTDSSSYLSRHLILDTVTHEQRISDFEFCFIELPKFAKREGELSSIIDKWTFFLKYLGSRGSEDKDFAQIFAEEPPLLQALEIARYHSLNPDELYVYEAQEERRRSDAETARTYKLDKEEEVRAEGRAEGEQIGMQKAIKVISLARDGLSAEAIAQELQIDIAEIERLLKA